MLNLFSALSFTVVYDASVWTEFGYIVQRYIAAGAGAGFIIFAIIFGIDLLFLAIGWITGVK